MKSVGIKVLLSSTITMILSAIACHSGNLESLFLFSLSAMIPVIISRKLLSRCFSVPRTIRPYHQLRCLSHNERVSYWTSVDHLSKYLEDVDGKDAIDWVLKENEITKKKLGDPKEKPLYNRVLSILDSKDKIPHVSKVGNYYYNFWQDSTNPRGILRRTRLDYTQLQCIPTCQGDAASMQVPNGKLCTLEDPHWELVLDIDLLGKIENESWVYGGYTVLEPEDLDEAPSRAMVYLSPGGSDAKVVREFDLVTKSFVEDGFNLPAAKSSVSWFDKDNLLVGTNFDGVVDGITSSLTDSGYPRVVCKWRRGTALSDAELQFEGETSDVSVSGYMSRHRGYKMEFRRRGLTFYTSKEWIRFEDEAVWHEIPVQEDAQVQQFLDQILITLRSDWTVGGECGEGGGVTFAKGSVLAVAARDLIANGVHAKFSPIFVPSERIALEDFECTCNYIVLNTLENVKSRIHIWHFDPNAPVSSPSGSSWTCVGSEKEAVIRGASIRAVDSDRSDCIWLTVASFTKPSTLYLVDISEGVDAIGAAMGHTPIKQLPAQFNADDLVESQFEATSSDGTKVPYFTIMRRDTPLDGSTPTLLYGYGGFEISLTPSYQGVTGAAWLEAGGCYVMANIRGGGEFGPQWHQAALKANRHRAYDDFIAVAEDLISRGITTRQRLAIRGGSNGGLLMVEVTPPKNSICNCTREASHAEASHRGGFGLEASLAKMNIFLQNYCECSPINTQLLKYSYWQEKPRVQKPHQQLQDLFGAVVCAVPLLDMKRFNKLLAGASWVGEYGDPDTSDWEEYLHQYSPYHNLDPSGDTTYPPLLMTTSTKDDRVHPYHARSFVKRLLEISGDDFDVDVEVNSLSKEKQERQEQGRQTDPSMFGTRKTFYYENVEGGHGGAADSKQQGNPFRISCRQTDRLAVAGAGAGAVL
eukprot:gene5263-10532_t